MTHSLDKGFHLVLKATSNFKLENNNKVVGTLLIPLTINILIQLVQFAQFPPPKDRLLKEVANALPLKMVINDHW